MRNAELVRVWRKWKGMEPPYLLAGDSIKGCKASVLNWSEAIAEEDFCRPNDDRVHLGLMPHPYCGDVLNARVYILMLNPGLNPSDYFGEYAVPGFRQALLGNLRQKFPNGSHRFLFLDPQFSWHSGFRWWHGKLAAVIQVLSDKWGCSFADARKAMAGSLASVELVPYHSKKSSAVSACLRSGLRSSELAREFVQGYVMPRVSVGEAILIVTRKADLWGVSSRDAIVYSPAQARAAHLTPQSLGGKAIIRHLLMHGPSR